ncbi:3971_t:CDS:2, partial [Ambispora gerdemannii]
MKKEIIRRSGIQLVYGQAKPGASLAFLKNMALFCREFNEKTKNKNGELVNVEITVYADKSYDYTISTPPSSYLIKKTVGEKKEITQAELEKIAQQIMPSLNTDNLEQAKKIVIGTARSAADFSPLLNFERRRRTRYPAISFGEPEIGYDPEISEWDNPLSENALGVTKVIDRRSGWKAVPKKQRGPPRKAKYSLVTDSELVP